MPSIETGCAVQVADPDCLGAAVIGSPQCSPSAGAPLLHTPRLCSAGRQDGGCFFECQRKQTPGERRDASVFCTPADSNAQPRKNVYRVCNCPRRGLFLCPPSGRKYALSRRMRCGRAEGKECRVEGARLGGKERVPGGREGVPGGRERVLGGKERVPGGRERVPGGREGAPAEASELSYCSTYMPYWRCKATAHCRRIYAKSLCARSWNSDRKESDLCMCSAIETAMPVGHCQGVRLQCEGSDRKS